MFKNLIRLRSDPTEFQCIFFSFMQLVHFLSDKKHISTAMHETVFKQLLCILKSFTPSNPFASNNSLDVKD